MAAHRMKATLILAVSAFLVVGLATPASADPGYRPFKGSVNGDVTFTPVPLQECAPSDLLYGGLRTDSSATGIASHLGRTVMSSHHCTPAGDAITGGAMTLVSDSGDKVYIEYSGSAPFPIPGITTIIVVHYDFAIVGGSGRFDGATGGGEMTARVVFEGFDDPVWAASWAWRGTIGY